MNRPSPSLVRRPAWLAPLGFACLALAACGTEPPVSPGEEEGARVEGQVTEDDGYAQRFGGEGSLAAASTVEAYQAGPGATWRSVATADINAEGRYELVVPPQSENLIVKAKDGSGEVVASAIFEQAGELDSTRACKPMTAESSVEAAVYERMIVRGMNPNAIDTIDLHERITAEVGAEVRARAQAAQHGEGPDDIEAQLDALADGVWAAQQAELHVYAEEGVNTTQREQFDSSVQAQLALNAAFNDDSASKPEAMATYRQALNDARADLGVSGEIHTRSALATSAAFRGATAASLEATVSSASAMQEACASAAAAYEARAVTQFNLALLEAEDASQSVITSTTNANVQLESAIASAESRADLEAAFATYAEALAGDETMSDSVLESFLQVDLIGSTVVGEVTAALEVAASTLEGDLEDDGEALAASGRSQGDVEAWAIACGESYNRFFAEADLQADVLATAFNDRGVAAAELMSTTQGSFGGTF